MNIRAAIALLLVATVSGACRPTTSGNAVRGRKGVGQIDNIRQNLTGEAWVYRDEHGVAHIEADDEPAAFYAMGFEEARNALFHIAVNVKFYRGETTRYLGVARHHISNDFVVAALRTHLGNRTEEELRETLQLEDSPTGNPDQLYDNLVAYTRGVNDYRTALQEGRVDAGELDARAWLLERGYDWVLEDPITVADAASWGGWSRADLAIRQARISERNPVQVSFEPNLGIADGESAPSTSASSRVVDPVASYSGDISHNGWFDIEKQLGRKFMGSNSYCWSYDFMEIDGVPHTGMVADPHQNARNWNDPRTGGLVTLDLAHVSFFHLIVPNQYRPEKSLNAFGYVQHANGVMFLCHNENVAIGGSLGPPNVVDAFLLRVDRTTWSPGDPAPRYYSHYHDVNGNNGKDDDDWQPMSAETIKVAGPDGQTIFAHTILRAGPYGIVVNPTPFFADDTTEWVAGQGANRFYPEDGPGRIPVLVAYRAPMADEVDRSPHHDRFTVGQYEVMHASDVYDVIEEVNDHEFTYFIQFDAVDREGRLFAVTNGAVPQRGDDDLLRAAGYRSFPEKWALYAQGSDPVPARWYSDRMFDWVFNVPGDPTSGLKYLKAEGDGGMDDPGYLPYVLYDPKDQRYNPPRVLSTNPNEWENPGWVHASNDVIAAAYRKRTNFSEKVNPDGNPFNEAVATNNALVNQFLEAGTAYHTLVFPPNGESNIRGKHVSDHLGDILRGNLGEDGADKMNLAGGLSFAQDTRNYVERDYQGPAGEDPDLSRLPYQVRVLVEAHRSLDQIEASYDRQVAFFQDLWRALYDERPGTDWAEYPLTEDLKVPLRQVWVGNEDLNPTTVFYYPETDGVPGPISFIEMPQYAALIDFHWKQSFPGVALEDRLVAFAPEERQELANLIAILETWDGSEDFRNTADSVAAALLAQYHLGFNAAQYDPAISRPWLPLFNGLLASDATAYAPCMEQPEAVKLLPGGKLPRIGPDGRLPNGKSAYVYLRGFTDFAAVARGETEFASWLDDDGAMAAFPEEVPFHALYADEAGRVVKDHLDPQDVNDIVEFFLNLGGWDADSRDGQIQSEKKVVFEQSEITRCDGDWLRSDELTAKHRSGYPLTRTMVRVLLLRRLLDTARQLRAWYGDALPTYGDIYRSRVYDYRGKLRWPLDADGKPDPAGVPMQGGGILRSVGCFPEIDSPTDAGFQRKMWCIGGSERSLFTFFPKDQPNAPPKSFFFNPPGERVAKFDSIHFGDLVGPFAANKPQPTHFQDYRDGSSPEYPRPIVHRPLGTAP